MMTKCFRRRAKADQRLKQKQAVGLAAAPVIKSARSDTAHREGTWEYYFGYIYRLYLLTTRFSIPGISRMSLEAKGWAPPSLGRPSQPGIWKELNHKSGKHKWAKLSQDKDVCTCRTLDDAICKFRFGAWGQRYARELETKAQTELYPIPCCL